MRIGYLPEHLGDNEEPMMMSNPFLGKIGGCLRIIIRFRSFNMVFFFCLIFKVSQLCYVLANLRN